MALVDDDDPGARESAALVLHGCKLHLRRRADRQIRHALEIGALQLAGYKAAEVREILGLSLEDYRTAVSWLKDAIGRTPREE